MPQENKKKERVKKMIKFGKWVVKFRIPILILSFLLLIPTGIIYMNTRINYDILSYLPGDIETMKGQDILLDEFGTGAFSVAVIDGMQEKEISQLEDKLKEIDHVKDVLWYGALADISIPMDMLPDDLKDSLQNADTGSQLMIITFDTSMSADETLDAIEEIRGLTNEQCLLSGMSAVVTDIKKICNSEVIMYVVIAAGLSALVLALTMDSFLLPFIFLLSIGMAIVYNLGTNFIAGEISFVTQALAAVLQLAVTMDYSIFLWHSYLENQERYPDDRKRAMSHAISQTLTSVVGSSITTIAGFLAMCFMTFTLGMDLGVVMAKGVVFGVIGCVTILPSMILAMDKWIEKTRHKAIIPDLGRIGGFVTKHYWIFIILFLVIIGPAFYGQNHNQVYYDLMGTLPDNLESVKAGNALENDFDMGATHVILASSDLNSKDARNLENEISDVDGVKLALGLDSVMGPTVPKDMIPDDIKEMLDNGKYQMIYVISEYKTGSDLSDGLNTLDGGIGQLKEKAGSLSTGADQLKSGTDQLATGASTLVSNNQKLNDGAGTLSDGTDAIIDGVGELSDGAHQLADGITEFSEDGIDEIINSYNGDIEPLVDRIQAVLDAGADYQTYTDIADGVNGSVKFIIKTDAVKAED